MSCNGWRRRWKAPRDEAIATPLSLHASQLYHFLVVNIHTTLKDTHQYVEFIPIYTRHLKDTHQYASLFLYTHDTWRTPTSMLSLFLYTLDTEGHPPVCWVYSCIHSTLKDTHQYVEFIPVYTRHWRTPTSMLSFFLYTLDTEGHPPVCWVSSCIHSTLKDTHQYVEFIPVYTRHWRTPTSMLSFFLYMLHTTLKDTHQYVEFLPVYVLTVSHSDCPRSEPPPAQRTDNWEPSSPALPVPCRQHHMSTSRSGADVVSCCATRCQRRRLVGTRHSHWSLSFPAVDNKDECSLKNYKNVYKYKGFICKMCYFQFVFWYKWCFQLHVVMRYISKLSFHQSVVLYIMHIATRNFYLHYYQLNGSVKLVLTESMWFLFSHVGQR